MKLIHCADLHLDSPMETNLPPEKARERRNEILATFSGLVKRAAENGAAAILIAGDLFDSRNITKRTEKYVLDLILGNPEIYFFYLSGNHDSGSLLKSLDPKPENLLTFGDTWTSYRFGNPGDDVMITGSENPDPETLAPNAGMCNIVMMHGTLTESGLCKPHGELIPLAGLKNKGLDYLAMGHLHAYQEIPVDERCKACYSGCLEGRGFDECGAKGYVLLDTANGRITHRFVPLARREIHCVECDVTGFSSQLDLEHRAEESVRELPRQDIVKMILTGTKPPEAPLDTAHLSSFLSERFYFAKAEDQTRLRIRPEDYRGDISLKGEFVRRVLASALSEKEKERVIACGFRALLGEDIGL